MAIIKTAAYMKILDRLFGKKIKIVSAYVHYGFARHEQSFVFPGNIQDDDIKRVLHNRNDGRLKDFSVIYIHKKRSKTVLCDEGKYRALDKSKPTEWYTD